MSFEKRQAASKGRVLGKSGLRLTGLYFASMVLLYVGERMVVESKGLRIALGLIAAGGVIFAIIARLGRSRRLAEGARPIEKRLLLFYVVGAVALLFYLVQADFVMEWLRVSFENPKAPDRWQGVFGVMWVVVLACAALPIVFIEISYADMDTKRTVDVARVERSMASALVLAMSLCLVFLLNFMGQKHNSKVDLSYFKTTRPSESSMKMIENLSNPLKVYMFFPGTSNEVLEHVESYFSELKSRSKHVEIIKADHVAQPDLAKKLSVTKNGVVVLKRKGKASQIIRVGTKLRRAKRKLRKLDSEFQAAFLKGARSQKIACVTVGHDELTRKQREGERGASIRDMRTVLRKLHFRTKDLGVQAGLASEIPKDCTVVIIADPRKAFFSAEINALRKYLEDGGRALVMLDPDSEWNGAELLGPYGLQMNQQRLANDKYFVRLSKTKADRHFIHSARFSSHPSVHTLSRARGRVVSLFYRAGSLSEMPSTTGLRPKVRFSIHAMPFTFEDKNSNYRFDPKTEKRKSFELAAVVTLPSSNKSPKGKKKKKKKGGDDGMRMIVIADGDLFSDKIFRHPGNAYLFVDMIRWLGGDEEYIGGVTSEEDVRIRHTRKEDQVWFYLTIFAVPLLVLGGGILYTRRRRSKS